MRPTLEQYADFIEGRADAETRDRIGAMLRDEQSGLWRFVDVVVQNSEAMTGWGRDPNEGAGDDSGHNPRPRSRPSLLHRILSALANAPLREWASWRARKGDFDRAIWAWEMICADGEETRGYSRDLYSLGITYWNARQIDNAVARIEAAFGVASEMGMIELSCDALSSLTKLYLEQRDFGRAGERLQSLKALRGGEQTDPAPDINAEAILAYYQRRFDDALRLFRQAEAQSIAVFGERNPVQGVILSNLASVYTALKEPEKAAETREAGMQLVHPHLSPEQRDVVENTDEIITIPLVLEGRQQHVLKLPDHIAA